MAQHTGTVAWFNNAKGYGFLSAEGLQDVFCHYTAIQSDGYRSLKEGMAVEFDVIKGEKGQQADKVVVIAKNHVSSPDAIRPAELDH